MAEDFRQEEHEKSCTDVLMPTLDGFEESIWCIDSAQVDCGINLGNNKLPANVHGDKRDKWSMSKLQNFKEWADRSKCSALCDAAFALKSDTVDRTFKFSLSFVFSKSDFFTAEGEWRSMCHNNKDEQQNSIIYIDEELTKDPRVVNIILFWFYTGTVVDVYTLTNGTCEAEELLAVPNQYGIVAQPNLAVNILEVYKLAHFFGLKKLMKKIRKHCFKPSTTSCFSVMEHKLACLLAKCCSEDCPDEDDLLSHIADSYVSYTRGLACLCRWPLLYSRKKWDVLMAAGKNVAHHWFAHVVPLYVYIFTPFATTREVIEWTSTLGLQEAAGKSLAVHVQVSLFDVSCLFETH